MKYFFTSIIFIGTYLFSFGQEINEVVKLDMFGNPGNTQNQMYINMMNRSKELNKDEKTILNSDWGTMEVTGKDGDTFAIDSANYNYATDQFFFTHENKLYYLFPEKTKAVKLGSYDFAVYTYMSDDKRKKGYFQVLVDGDFPLLKRIYLKKIVTNDHPMNLYQANRVHYEKTGGLYYINPKINTAEKLPKKKKKFINLFRKRQAKLLRFAKEKEISTTDENDMIMFFQFNKMINTEQNQ